MPLCTRGAISLVPLDILGQRGLQGTVQGPGDPHRASPAPSSSQRDVGEATGPDPERPRRKEMGCAGH